MSYDKPYSLGEGELTMKFLSTPEFTPKGDDIPLNYEGKSDWMKWAKQYVDTGYDGFLKTKQGIDSMDAWRHLRAIETWPFSKLDEKIEAIAWLGSKWLKWESKCLDKISTGSIGDSVSPERVDSKKALKTSYSSEGIVYNFVVTSQGRERAFVGAFFVSDFGSIKACEIALNRLYDAFTPRNPVAVRGRP